MQNAVNVEVITILLSNLYMKFKRGQRLQQERVTHVPRSVSVDAFKRKTTGMTELIFVHPRNESQWPVLPQGGGVIPSRCCQRSSVLQPARDIIFICLSTRQCSISLCQGIIKVLQQETLDFIDPDLWPPEPRPESANPVDYKVWGVMQQRLYECRMNSD